MALATAPPGAVATVLYISCRGVPIRKGHGSVRTSVFKSRFSMFFGTAVFF